LLDAPSATRLIFEVDEVSPELSVTYNSTGGTSTRGQITGAPNTLNGVSLAANDRLLLKDQTNATQNGIWVVTTLGSGANGVWDRATDFDSDAEVSSGATLYVSQGVSSDNRGTYVLTAPDPITIGGGSGTNLTFTNIGTAGGYAGGAGLTLTDLTFDIGTASSSRIVVNADNIDLATVGSAGSAGSATAVPVVTVDAYGRVTALTSTNIAITSTAISDFNEAAQDAIGSILTDSATIDFTYNDGANTIIADVINDSITYAKIQNVTTARLLGRATAGSGDVEEITLGTGLSFTGTTLNGASTTTTIVGYIEGSTATTIDLDANAGVVKDVDGNNIAFTLPANLNNFEVQRNGQVIYRTGSLTTRDYAVNTGTNEITLVVPLTATEILVVKKLA